ncbi:Uncharacterised protein [Mycobacteroides abscessus subsp. abscessus]|nr:Uncharacterised protein [Mycobacteroides abscessus subsp. abscessus]
MLLVVLYLFAYRRSRQPLTAPGAAPAELPQPQPVSS